MASEDEAQASVDRQKRDRAKERNKDDEREAKRAKKESKSRKRDRTNGVEDQELEDPKPAVESSNGEISMSIEETNRVRISLGLKPLQLDSKPKEAREEKDADAMRAEEAKKASEAEFARKLKEKKEARITKEKLRAVQTLGEAGDDVDDLKIWAARSKKAEDHRKKQERLKAERLARQLAEQEESGSDEELLQNGGELAGMKVKHNAEELNSGETMILTLADRNILDDKGEIIDDAEELENTLVTEDKLRRKARKAATKENKPLFGEDGKRRGLLEQYDEEEAEAGMEIDASGALEAARQQKQAEIRAKLQQAEQQSAATSAAPRFREGGDYFTNEEMAQFQKPKQKKKRKIRRKEADEEGGGLDIAALEAEAAQLANGNQDRGSRGQRASKEERDAAERQVKERDRQARYDNALHKASIKAQILQKMSLEPPEEEDADDGGELEASLARARQAAQKKSENQTATADALLAAAEQRKLEREKAEQEQKAKSVILSETTDFANNIEVKKEDAKPEPQGEMHEEEEEAVPEPEPEPTPPPPKPQPSTGGWVSADTVDAVPEDTEMIDVAPEVKKEEPEDFVREKKLGSGLAGAMEMLRGRGELKEKVEWSGRNNDMKGDKLQGLDDVYRGGNHQSLRDANIERALTQRDAFGRVMTPKERFRDLCHNFHGKTISKTKQEKQLRRMQDELEARRAATGEGSANAFSRIAGAHVAGTPYTVISGKVQPGQSSDPVSGLASLDQSRMAPTPVHGSLTPMLGGSETPLVGDRKVEVMMGITREHARSNVDKSMPPPPRRNFRK